MCEWKSASEQYNKAIDDFAELVEIWCWKHEQYNQDDLNDLMEISDKLKKDDKHNSEKCKYWNAEHEDCALSTNEIYNSAIDDFADKIISLCDDVEFMNRFNEFTATTILEIAEQLKESFR